ncbi:xylulose-5-phosphate/fructose-6-phosphate phosphoketolase [Palleronia marisminoris]|uniref:Xylulose-5-phosphate phosphoketolase n=1 Tax=Palleronia marisminoris TaxID=315423 RepID=A0A1Y5TN85_9RHOB|nr:phosphoketolase family protein [Palleronia marisminoris]SFH39433.1 xylulose-5-phosphate/fructose-6-phosphate phosphoketolase [Palleronia marisminoris]SLN64214.1 Xylulose-5-phosphate phosphoketolase [Palleronia marisminoris]
MTAPDLKAVDAWWRAANYLSAAQIYLQDNPLLDRPLAPEDIKRRLLGHWGTTPGLTFCMAHANRAILAHDRDLLFIAGPGHGGPAVMAGAWLDGSLGERDPRKGWTEEGMRKLFHEFSFPGGVPSHAAAAVPGSIHEGGELGYSLAHATGAAFDNPGLTVMCVVGDGEAETGALATSWHSHRFLRPGRDGNVLPILHLNGYRIAAPTILGRMEDAEIDALFRGYGWAPIFVEGDDPAQMHRDMAAAVDACLGTGDDDRPPMIVLRSPKGWTGPETVDGDPVEGTAAAHQVPLKVPREEGPHLRQLEDWLRSYGADALFPGGVPSGEVRSVMPAGDRRLGATPFADGGRLTRPLDLPDAGDFAVDLPSPGAEQTGATGVLGEWLAELMRRNPETFRLFGPDETKSNKLSAVFDVTDRMAPGPVEATDDHLSPEGRVMEVLSEHLCEGWLEGYLLTGRHGLFNSYEAFIHIIASMANQHIKWMREAGNTGWRAPIPSLNWLLSSHVWRQDHNGFTHQDPGFMNHLAAKGADMVRLYLPPDANSLLAVAETVFASRDRANCIVAGKQPEPQWLTLDAARAHLQRGFGIWDWAADDPDPEVVVASAGDVPTMEALAAVDLLRDLVPDLRLRFVNVVDLMALQPPSQNAERATDEAFAAAFGTDAPVVFNFHGYPGLIHELAYRRAGHERFHVHGYAEKGTTTTPFNMAAMNEIDRFSIALDVLDRSGRTDGRVDAARKHCHEMLERQHAHSHEHGDDLPEVANWRWSRG